MTEEFLRLNPKYAEKYEKKKRESEALWEQVRQGQFKYANRAWGQKQKEEEKKEEQQKTTSEQEEEKKESQTQKSNCKCYSILQTVRYEDILEMKSSIFMREDDIK